MGHWRVKVSFDAKVFVSVLTPRPVEKSRPHSKGEEAENTINIEIVCAFIAVSSLDWKHLFCQLCILSVFDLPKSHKIVYLRAQCFNRIADKTDELIEFFDIETQFERMLEVISYIQLCRWIKEFSWLWLISISLFTDTCLVSFDQELEAELEQAEKEAKDVMSWFEAANKVWFALLLLVKDLTIL